jgi:hypothetical protein
MRHEFFKGAKIGPRTDLRDIEVDGKQYQNKVPRKRLLEWISGS